MICDKCNGTGYYSPNMPHYKCTACIGALKYAGIGSRETPIAVGATMKRLATELAFRGWVLRSGRARQKHNPPPNTCSADLMFEEGCDLLKGKKVIRVPTSFQKLIDAAQVYHPNWGACDEYAQSAHARNVAVMLGDWLDDPVKFVVCWTAGGKVTGGTGFALRIAAAHNIQVFNLADSSIDDVLRHLNNV